MENKMKHIKHINEGILDGVRKIFNSPRVVDFTDGEKKEIKNKLEESTFSPMYYDLIPGGVSGTSETTYDDHQSYNKSIRSFIGISAAVPITINFRVDNKIKLQTRESSYRSGSFHFNDRLFDRIGISCYKFETGKKIEFVIDNIQITSTMNSIWRDNSFRFLSLDDLIDKVILIKNILCLIQCMGVDSCYVYFRDDGYIKMFNLCNDYSIFMKNKKVSKIRLEDMIEDIKEDNKRISVDIDGVVTNLRLLGFTVV